MLPSDAATSDECRVSSGEKKMALLPIPPSFLDTQSSTLSSHPSSLHEADLITDANLPASAAGHHADCEGRLFLRKGCHQHDAFVFAAPSGVRQLGIGKAKGENAVARDPPTVEYGQSVAHLGRETFYGIAIEGNDGRHFYYMDFLEPSGQ